jgi:PPIC-type PPIASE domain
MGGVAFAQSAPPAAQAGTPAPPDRKVTALPVIPDQEKPSTPVNPASIPPTAPVITLRGFCPKSAATSAKTSTASKDTDCKTVVTKAEFERLANVLSPKMPAQAKQKLAADYSHMMVLSDVARKRGLETTDHYKEFLAFAKMQLLAQELLRTMQEKAKPTPAEVQKYYQENAGKYQQISLKRVFIPRNNPNAKPDDKKPSDEDLKAEGEKVRERLAGGADFDTVQKEIYTANGYQTPPPPTTIPEWRRDQVPANQTSLFDLKQGELSPVMVEPAGAYVYRLEEKKMVPVETLKAEIENQLANEKFRKDVETLTATVKPELNEAYFRSIGAVGEGPMGSAGAHAMRPNMVPRPGDGRSMPVRPSIPKDTPKQ